MRFINRFGHRGVMAFCVGLAITSPSALLSQELPNNPEVAAPSASQAVSVPLWNDFRYGMSPEDVVEILKGMNPKFRPEAKYKNGHPAEIKMKGAYISFQMFDKSWYMKFKFDEKNKLYSVTISNGYYCINDQLSLMADLAQFMKAKYPVDSGGYSVKFSDIYDVPLRRVLKNDATSVEIFVKTISAYDIAQARAFPASSFSRLDLERQYASCPQFGGGEASLEITYTNRAVQDPADQAAARARSESERIQQESRENQMKSDINKL